MQAACWNVAFHELSLSACSFLVHAVVLYVAAAAVVQDGKVGFGQC